MREFMHFFRSIEWPVQLVGIGTLLLWIFKATVLNRFSAPEPIPDLGNVAEGLFSAIISGYLFYVIFALWPEYKDRKKMQPYLKIHVASIVGDCVFLMNQISHENNKQMQFRYVRQEELEGLFDATSAQFEPAIGFFSGSGIVRGNWLTAVSEMHNRTKKSIDSLMKVSRFLDAGIIHTIAQIENCSFFHFYKSVIQSEPFTGPHKNLGVYGHIFWEYLELCRLLASWHDKHLSSGEVHLFGDQT